MKLSEAIRLGAMLRPQARYVLYDEMTRASCAIGAAAEAIGILDVTATNQYRPGTRAPVAWKWVDARHGGVAYRTCPSCGESHGDAFATITTLNNHHGWDREQIADWVATIEPQEEAPTTKPQGDGDNTPIEVGVVIR